MQGDSSLFERFFRGRYYHKSEISKASLGFKPSYSWSSILNAKEVVTKGTRWKIGKGRVLKFVRITRSQQFWDLNLLVLTEVWILRPGFVI